MIKRFVLAICLFWGINVYADCLDELDPNNTIRSNDTVTLDDAKRSSIFILQNFQPNEEPGSKNCVSIAGKIVFEYFENNYGIPKINFLFPDEDFTLLFLIHTFTQNNNLTPTVGNYKSFFDYLIALNEKSSSKQLTDDLEAQRPWEFMARLKQWKAEDKLDSVANVAYEYAKKNVNNSIMAYYCDSLCTSYLEGTAPIFDIKISDKEFESVTKELRLKLITCTAYSFYCKQKGIKNKYLRLAERYLEKWKKIQTDRFGEILLSGDKKDYISNRLSYYALKECNHEMDFNDYYIMIEKILIDNQNDEAFKTYIKMYKDRTLYDFLRNKYLRNQANR